MGPNLTADTGAVIATLACMLRVSSLTAVLVFLLPNISNASPISWNGAADFSSADPSGQWSYGHGTTGSLFIPYTDFNSPCDGQAGTACWQPPAADIQFGVPLVGIDTTSSAFSFGTVVLQTGVLWMHPANGPVASDSIVRWTAPASGTFSISGLFELLDTNPTGVFVGIYDNSLLLDAAGLASPGATPPGTPGQQHAFSLLLNLNAGDVISFGVNNGGVVFNDSTGLDATIRTVNAVPEPTSVTLVAGGTALLWLRKRRRNSPGLR